MLRSFKVDKSFGENSEEINKPLFDSFFNESFKKLHPTHIMDFESTTSFLEIKTRTNTYNKYPTTMIPYNKINYANKTNKDVYFIFVFTDGKYYIKYDKESFTKYTKNLFKRADRIDHKDLLKEYVYIPITDLTEIIL